MTLRGDIGKYSLQVFYALWHVGRVLKSLCRHGLSVIVIVVIVFDQFSYTHTKTKKVLSLYGGIIIQLYFHERSFLHVLGISALKFVPL